MTLFLGGHVKSTIGMVSPMQYRLVNDLLLNGKMTTLYIYQGDEGCRDTWPY